MFDSFEKVRRMLGHDFPVGRRPRGILEAADCRERLPTSYVEWAMIDGGAELLHQYSNTDSFWFDPKAEDIVRTDSGDVLLFCRESQGNFELGVLLSADIADPPVMFSDYRRDRWTQYCGHFSDAILVQIFDWQHRLVFDHNRGSAVDHYDEFYVSDQGHALSALRKMYQEFPDTRWFMETSDDAQTWRFSTLEDERILLSSDPARSNCWVEVYAPSKNRVERCNTLARTLKLQL